MTAKHRTHRSRNESPRIHGTLVWIYGCAIFAAWGCGGRTELDWLGNVASGPGTTNAGGTSGNLQGSVGGAGAVGTTGTGGGIVAGTAAGGTGGGGSSTGGVSSTSSVGSTGGIFATGGRGGTAGSGVAGGAPGLGGAGGIFATGGRGGTTSSGVTGGAPGFGGTGGISATGGRGATAGSGDIGSQGGFAGRGGTAGTAGKTGSGGAAGAGVAGVSGSAGAAGKPGTGGTSGVAGATGTAGTTGIIVCPPPLPGVDTIDDMNDGDRFILPGRGRSGAWSTSGDATPGATMTPAPGGDFPMTETGDPCRKRAAYVQGSGFALGGASFSVGLGSPYNASAYRSLTFWAKVDPGTTPRLRVSLPDKDTHPDGGICQMTGPGPTLCWDHYGLRVAFTTDWAQYTVPFSSLTQNGWGHVGTAFDPASIYEVVFEIPVNANFGIWIDDLAFSP